MVLIEAAARSLYEHLKGTGIVSTVAPGRCQDEPALCVYLKMQDRRLKKTLQVWQGYRIVYRRTRNTQ